jgi:DNA-binding beta-propeller fold protein YncE
VDEVTDTITREAPFEELVGWERIPEGFTHLDVADVAVDADDNVYLLTRLQARVLVYDREGTYLRSWGEDSFSNRPHGLTIGPDGIVYYVDEGEHLVRRFDLEGNELGTIGTRGVPSDTGHDKGGKSAYERVATVVRSAGPFNRPTALAVAPDGTLYVSDGYGNARVHRFSAEGELLHSWGEPGIGPGEFHVPHSILVLPDERVLVADRENDRIQVFAPDGSFLAIWDDIQRPTALALDPDGRIFVGELAWWTGERSWIDGFVYVQKPGRISVLEPDGTVAMRWSGGAGRGPGEFIAPHGIALDSRGDLYVGETAYTFTKANGVSEPEVNSFHKFVRSGS